MISIVIPVYNEEAAIGEDLDVIIEAMDASGYDYEVIVVDDGSTDRTAEIVRQRPSARLISHLQNRGVGAARMTGMQAARGEIIVMTDGDGTYPNQDIPRLLEYTDRYDMVVGARRREMGSLKPLRSLVKLLARLLASYLTETMIPDLNSGFRAFRKGIAERYLDILPRGHSWEGTITVAFLNDGYTVRFIPIDYYRRKGKSTIHPIRDTWNYFLLVVRTAMYFNPLKVFLPISLFFLSIGAIKLIRDLIVFNLHVPTSTVMIVLTGVQIGALGLLADLIVRRGRL